VVAEEGVTASAIADGAADLIGKSLVFGTASVATVEFRLLETSRAYAFDRPNESGALANVAARHAEYLRDVLRGMEDEQRSTPLDELGAYRPRNRPSAIEFGSLRTGSVSGTCQDIAASWGRRACMALCMAGMASRRRMLTGRPRSAYRGATLRWHA
jgi:hypothetical protein